MSNIQEAIKEIDEMIGHMIGPFGEEPECDSLKSIKKLLESEPEPTEFTKKARFQLNEGTLPVTKQCLSDSGKYHIPRDIVEYYLQACDIIDRLTAENKNLKDEIEKAYGRMDSLEQALKGD